MKKFILKTNILIMTAAFIMVMNLSIPANSGDFHKSGSLLCSDCHTMHYSEGGQPAKTPAGTAYNGPSPFLIRSDSINLLCLSCHDGSIGGNGSAPDVMGIASYETGSLKRAAGAFQNTVGLASHKGHSLAVPNETAPGSNPIITFQTGLTCVSCHDSHGNNNYRNLKTSVGNSTSLVVSYQDTVYSGSSAIFQSVLNPASVHYAIGNIQYRKDSVVDGLSQWCKGCHTDFHGPAGDPSIGGTQTGDDNSSGSEWLRHPTSGITLSRGVTNQHIDANSWFGSNASRLPVVSASNTIPGTSGSSDNQVGCMTCHKSHGSSNPKGLIYDDSSTSNLEDGTSLYQSCQQCHNK